MPYGPSQWCHPIATMHHVGSEEVSEFDAFENSRGLSSPMRIKDIYHEFVEKHLVHFRVDWDNASEDTLYMDVSSDRHADWDKERAKTDDLSEQEAKAHHSFDNCRRTCEERDDCFQFMFRNEVCGLARTFSYGKPAAWTDGSPAEERSFSGWNMNRIRAWVAEHQECGELEWPRTSG